MTKYMCFQSLLPYFSNVSEPIGKDKKISQYSEGTAPPYCFGTGHVTVLSTPPRKMEYSGVR